MSHQQYHDEPSTPTSPDSDGASTTTYSSPHTRRGQTRREALDRLKHCPSSRSKRRPIVHAGESDATRPLPAFPQESNQDELSKQPFTIRPSKGDGGTVTTATVTTASASTSTRQAPTGYSALSDECSDKTPINKSAKQVDNVTSSQQEEEMTQTTPQQDEHQEEQEELLYYQITYQGVVALLSEPHASSSKSGAYVSYGEVVASRQQVIVDDEGEGFSLDSTIISPRASCDSPPQSVLSQHAGSVSSLDTLRTVSTTAAPSQITTLTKSHVGSNASQIPKKLIRVDKVLTGGYAVDALQLQQEVPSLHSNNTSIESQDAYLPMVGPSPLPLPDDNDETTHYPDGGAITKYGYLYSRKRNTVIAEQLSTPPMLSSGTFLYQIVSSAPLVILTGPRVDAPRTRAMLLPGTVHEVCLKMSTQEYDLIFLRLSHRRGWITDRRVTLLGSVVKIGATPAVKEVTDSIGHDYVDDNITVSAISLASTSIASSTGSSVRRRHRPPRRIRQAAAAAAATTEKSSSGLPRHVGGSTLANTAATQNHSTPTKNSSPTPQTSNASPGRMHHDKIPTPSSNISILSDDESFDLGSSYRFPTGLTPDRSYSSSTRKRHGRSASEPTLFLMHVNAPRGLRILDAPHFQVSNLIHGKNEGQPSSSSLQQSSTTPSKGIFQTMSTHHTAKAIPKRASQTGNPAIFDSITKTRILPRGVVFEASKRMEASGGAFHKAAGLVKLSDNSGWAIVPHQQDLNSQYKNFQGGAASVRQGEATRAFEEVGNAVVDTFDGSSGEQQHPRNPSIWVRVVAKNGVTVACPSPIVPVAKDDETSPTSSAGSSSVVSGGGGGGSNYGVMSGPESDVASSVGSAFLDAMFRTPKKPNHKTVENRTLHDAVGRQRETASELQDVPNLLPCGSCVEVDRWEDTEGDDEPGSVYRSQDYVRLRGGQGWIPLNQAGMTVSAVIAKPDIRLGSFWFRVTSRRGIKVRLGPSRKAGSIKSDDGVYFRFECGEFLRASEVLTVFRNHDEPSECYAKLYRNRHVRLNNDDGEYRQLLSLTTPAEWVQVYNDDKLFLEECGAEPEILRHREGWRYNVVSDEGVSVRKGPSLNAEDTGVYLLAGESVVITERVTPPDETVVWLRLKDGEGWMCDTDSHGQTAVIAHSLRHRTRPKKSRRPERDDIAYNSIVARLFHDGVPGSQVGDSRAMPTSSTPRSRDDDDAMRNRRQLH